MVNSRIEKVALVTELLLKFQYTPPPTPLRAGDGNKCSGRLNNIVFGVVCEFFGEEHKVVSPTICLMESSCKKWFTFA